MNLKLLSIFSASLLIVSDAYAQDAPLPTLDLTQWSGSHAMDYIGTQLSFGPRVPGMEGHKKTIDFILAELAKTKATVDVQQWDYFMPDGTKKPMTNIIARFDPANPRRIIIGTHYDSILHAYRDAKKPEAPMPGANNSASGVALLLETARLLGANKAKPPLGVDVVFFDGEEGPLSLGAGDPHWFAIGSPYFASHMSKWYPAQKPEKSVIFDMVCAKDLKLYPEKISMHAASGEVDKFWNIGTAMAPTIFSRRVLRLVNDDQSALINAGIPSILVIGFDYAPFFNTTQDTADKCSADSLQAVGKTLVTYLFQN